MVVMGGGVHPLQKAPQPGFLCSDLVAISVNLEGGVDFTQVLPCGMQILLQPCNFTFLYEYFEALV